MYLMVKTRNLSDQEITQLLLDRRPLASIVLMDGVKHLTLMRFIRKEKLKGNTLGSGLNWKLIERQHQPY